MKKVLLSGMMLMGILALSAQKNSAAVNQASLGRQYEVQELKKTVDVNRPLQAISTKTLGTLNAAVTGVQAPINRGNMLSQSATVKATTADEMFVGELFLEALSVGDQKAIMWKVTGEKTADGYAFANFIPYDGLNAVKATVNGTDVTIAKQSIGSLTLQGQTFDFDLVGINANMETGAITEVGDITGTLDLAKEGVTFTCGFGLKITNLAEVGGGAEWFNLFLMPTMIKQLPLAANYIHPIGTLFYGLSEPSLLSLTNLNGVAAPDAEWEWTNLTDSDVAEFEWKYSQLVQGETGIEEKPFTSTDRDLKMQVKRDDLYTYPELTATAGGQSSVFSYGLIEAGEKNDLFVKNESNMVIIQAGGTSIPLPGPSGEEWFHLTNFNSDAGMATYTNGTSGFLFGTYRKQTKTTEALYSLFEPASKPISFVGVNAIVTNFTPMNLPLRMEIKEYSLDEKGNPVIGELIAFSETYIHEEKGVLVKFTDFQAEDEDGIVSTLENVFIKANTPFVLVLSGFNQQGASFSLLSEYENRPDGQNYSYFSMKNDDGTMDEGLYSWNGITYTMYMELAGVVYGAEDESGISPVETSNQTSVFSTDDAFNFSYTKDFTSIEVYNVNGQKVSAYALPQTGAFSIDKSTLSDGVYLFRMNGKTTEVLRAVK